MKTTAPPTSVISKREAPVPTPPIRYERVGMKGSSYVAKPPKK